LRAGTLSHDVVVEYIGGLRGCSGTVLGVATGHDGGMVIDNKGDIIAPPYTSVTSTIPATFPFHVTLNQKNDRVYIASYDEDEVYVDSYPSGTNEATLTSSNGIDTPGGAVDGMNFVP
jgi:hypothetical protein